MSSLRERNKARRKDRILDAALAVVRENGATRLTIEKVARLADVSPATVYNLVGTKDKVLLATIDRAFARLRIRLPTEHDAPDAPVKLILGLAEQAVAVLISDEQAYRDILAHTGQFSTTGASMAFDPARMQVDAVLSAQRNGIIRAGLDAPALGRQFYICYLGGLYAWVSKHLTNEGFLIATRQNIIAVLAASVTEPYRAQYLAMLQVANQNMAAASWNLEVRQIAQ